MVELTNQLENQNLQRPLLDTVRWVSAFLVMLGHAIALICTSSSGNVVLHHIADLRGIAVVIFFVLSGYLVGGTVLRNATRFNFQSYFIARFTRIYVVLVPALIFTLIVDGLIFRINPENAVFASVWPGGALGTDPIFSRYGWTNIIGSVLSIEPLLGHPIGSAGSLWSLGYEWIFYFIFPGAYLFGNRFNQIWGGNLAVGVSILLIAVGSKVSAAYWLIWLAGAYASKYRISYGTMPMHIVYGISTLVMVMCAPLLDNRVSLLGVGILFALYLSARNDSESTRIHRTSHFLSGLSYSLYVVHLQLQSFVVAMMYESGIIDRSGITDPVHVAFWVMLLLSLSFLVAWVSYIAFEKHTNSARQKVHNWLCIKQKHSK